MPLIDWPILLKPPVTPLSTMIGDPQPTQKNLNSWRDSRAETRIVWFLPHFGQATSKPSGTRLFLLLPAPGTAIEGAGAISVTDDPAKESALADRPDLKLDRSGRQVRRCANRIDDCSSDRDGSSAQRANKLDLSHGLNFPDPDNMSGPAGWAANLASVCGHITRREGRGNRSPVSTMTTDSHISWLADALSISTFLRCRLEMT
jgi:hypothetical protein